MGRTSPPRGQRAPRRAERAARGCSSSSGEAVAPADRCTAFTGRGRVSPG